MDKVIAIVCTICVVSVLLNIGLITKYVTIGHTAMCIPSMGMGELE